MKKLQTKLFLFLVLATGWVLPAFSQSLKEPSPTEKKFLVKPIHIIQSVLDQFGDNDWSLDSDDFNNNPVVPINDDGTGPINIDSDFERIYKVKENSKRYNTLIKPLAEKEKILSDKLSQMPQEEAGKDNSTYDSLIAKGKQLSELYEIDVYAYINDDFIKGRPINEPDINVKGASIVTKLNKGYYADENWTSYFLAFGNWKNIKLNKEFNCYYYKFKNTKTSSIQNIVIVMTGAQDRMKELMHKIDWSVLNKALTD